MLPTSKTPSTRNQLPFCQVTPISCEVYENYNIENFADQLQEMKDKNSKLSVTKTQNPET